MARHTYPSPLTFLVTGRGPFPDDMMRYARAKFSSPADKEEAERKRDRRDPYKVKIDFEVPRDGQSWVNAVAGRFASFGARMVRYGR